MDQLASLGGVIFLLVGDLPKTVSTLSNLSLFRLMAAICKLVSYSMGEPESRRGQRDCWLVVWWIVFGVLALGLATLLTAGLDVVYVAAAPSDQLETAMVEQ
jgi:hypothetical protein